jgi:hypothetical protein
MPALEWAGIGFDGGDSGIDRDSACRKMPLSIALRSQPGWLIAMTGQLSEHR